MFTNDWFKDLFNSYGILIAICIVLTIAVLLGVLLYLEGRNLE
ncbi:hypothetical protein [Paenibacillus odorifer]|nr:hypothetical protein [Paenibacillus odorifer]